MNSTKIIKLGEKLVNELLLYNRNDTLSKWMAHYIAELIEKANNNEGKIKEKYEKECFETILKLWKEVDKVPNIKTPLSSFQKLYELYEEILYNKKTYRYFPKKKDDITNPFLILAKDIDRLSKNIVENIFLIAYQDAIDKEKEWFEFEIIEDVKQLKSIEHLLNYKNDLHPLLSKNEKNELIESLNRLLEIVNT